MRCAPNKIAVTIIIIMITRNSKPFDGNICGVTTVNAWDSGRAQSCHC